MYYTEFRSAVGSRTVETDLLFPKEEISFLQQNCKKDAYFALLSARSDTAQKKQYCFPVEKMDWVIDHLDVKADTWISQSTFFAPSRRIVCLSGISSLFLDLDYYKTDWGKNKTPEEAASQFVRICQEVGIPIPSLIVLAVEACRLSGFSHTTFRVRLFPDGISRSRRFAAVWHRTGRMRMLWMPLGSCASCTQRIRAQDVLSERFS